MPERFDDEPAVFDITDREILHEGKLLTFVREAFDYNGATIVREFLEYPGAVGVIAIDAEDRVLTIKQYRHPIRTRAWEAPAGLLDVAGESLLLTAQRELAEEADLVASEWNVLLDFTPSSGMGNERIRVFLARGLSATGSAYLREDEEADIELRWVPLDEVVAAALDGRIHNIILIAGVLAAASARDRQWANLREAIAS